MIWEKAPLSSIATVTMGQSPSKLYVNRAKQGLPLLNGPTEFTEKSPLPVQWTTNPSKIGEEGSILFCVRGSTTGRMNLADQKYAIGRGLASIVGRNKLDTKFIEYTLRINLPILLCLANGSTFPNISRNDLENLEITLPPEDLRFAIASLLGALDDKIESNSRLAQNLELLIFSHFEQNFGIAEHTDKGVPLSSLFAVNPKYSLKRGINAIKVSMADISPGNSMISSWQSTPAAGGSRFKNGDVIFSRITPCLENGKTAIVDILSEGEVAFGSTEFIVLSPRGEISTAWIYALCRQKQFRTICTQNMTGTSGRQRLNATFFDDYRISEPNTSCLQNFNQFSLPALESMTNYRKENVLLTELRDTLLPELMSGRMHVDEAKGLVMEALDAGGTA